MSVDFSRARGRVNSVNLNAVYPPRFQDFKFVLDVVSLKIFTERTMEFISYSHDLSPVVRQYHLASKLFVQGGNKRKEKH